LLGLEGRKLAPCERVFEVAPDPFNGVELRTIGWQEHESHIFRESQALGNMRPTVVEQEEMQAVRKGLRKALEEELEHVGVQIRQLEEEVLACGRLDGAIDIEPLEAVLDRPNRLYPAGGEPPPADGQEAEAAFVLAEDADGARIGGRNCLPQVARTTCLKGWDGIRVFLCGSAGPL